MRIAFWGLFATLFFSITSFGQAPVIPEEDLAQLKEWEDTIALTAYAIINDSLPENRFGATKKLIPTLVKALKTKNSFYYPFSRVQSISILYPPDSTFRIFSWQLYVDENDYRYYGAIQMNSPDLQLFPLVDRSFEVEDLEYAILSADKWYGALYYAIKSFDTPQGQKFLLFGFDGFSFFNKRKLIEVLSFEGGIPRFGAPVFHHLEGDSTLNIRNRRIFDYSAEAAIKCNFDPVLEMVVMDHLVEVGERYQGQGTTQIPDGTYEAYQLSEGYWKHIPNLGNQILDKPPRPFPVLERENGIDIFGNKKKG